MELSSSPLSKHELFEQVAMESIDMVMPIPGFDGYFASPDGKIFNKKGKEIQPRFRKENGYLVVDLYKDKKRTTFYIHTLVTTTYLGKRPTEKHQVRHLDGVKINNNIFNLKWGTAKENAEDKLRTGSYNNTAKLSDEKVRIIRRNAGDREVLKNLSKEYKVHYCTLRAVIRGETWRHVL